MDAPSYPPATHFEMPVRQPRVLSTATSSFAELMAIPEIKAMLFKEAPGMAMTVNTPMLRPHLGNMAPRDLVTFGVAAPEALDRIDAKLRAMGPVR